MFLILKIMFLYIWYLYEAKCSITCHFAAVTSEFTHCGSIKKYSILFYAIPAVRKKKSLLYVLYILYTLYLY